MYQVRTDRSYNRHLAKMAVRKDRKGMKTLKIEELTTTEIRHAWGYKWVARDHDGNCWVFENKPSFNDKDVKSWFAKNGKEKCIGAECFPSLHVEDTEPTKIV